MSVYAGRAVAVYEPKTFPLIATLRQNAFTPATATDGAQCDVELLAVTAAQPRTRVVETSKSEGGKLELTEAPVVVSGGRGLQGPENFHLIEELAAAIAGLCVYFFFHLSVLEGGSLARRILLALFPIFGTWTWCNLGFGGAWQIALGLALLGQAAALYFTLARPSPLIAGAFFALAFGNRTELLITLPIYLYLLSRPLPVVGRALRLPSPGNRSGRPTTFASSGSHTDGRTGAATGWKKLKRELRENAPMLVRFLTVPATLALLTAGYNFARFHSIFDFGYIHIPGVREEPWYEHGLFSISAIPWNIYTMLFQGFESIAYFPYMRPDAFGCSILLASPFLCLLFRQGGRFKIAAWIAIGLLTLVLWLHGNPGSWQFSYRYAMILIPWMFLLLAGNGPANLSVLEVSLFAISVAINAIATWQFLWTNEIQP